MRHGLLPPYARPAPSGGFWKGLALACLVVPVMWVALYFLAAWLIPLLAQPFTA